MTSIDELIAQGVNGRISQRDADALCRADGLQPAELYNRIAVRVATRFYAGLMSFEDADSVINDVWRMMLEGADDELQDPAVSIFEAFDAGEYDHGDG